ncbi:PqiC family protein [Roseobacter sp. YSTF-M11]|uniref:PqiC family protein n=1 Tax=Roseobacter insulae TaxID=2859783 RepID=A0A9X1FV97_9RHOB|nr:ABC-type transport auxiliary lipoprotein family protein [Roseobacter insulae]MBW4708366.1 PqiC family protein [Roseobacter insulae]
MARITSAFCAVAFGLLAACAPAPDRYVIPAPDVADRQRIAFQSVEIREISLPAYAASDEISSQSADGRLTSDGGVLWADTPERAVALELARHLSRLSGARVASAPWPLEALPDARLELRFESLVARDDGQFRANGQYFVAVANGGRERSGLFDLSRTFDPAGGPQAIAAARGQIILDLAQYIAINGLR